MPEPRSRTPAQIEASRRNGARSRGPVTPEGKARASRNAVKHGLTAMTHLVLEGEDAGELEELTFRMVVETGAVSEIEARLARRLAIAFWKGERAERMEVALLAAAPKIRPPAHGYQWEAADPLTTFDVKRFNAIRGAQAQIGREIKSCLQELRRLRDDPLPEGTGEPDEAWENEPGSPPPANDDAAEAVEMVAAEAGVTARNEPENPAEALSDEPDTAATALTPLQQAIRAELDSLVASGEEEPDLTRLTRLTRELCLPQRRAG